MNEVLDRPAVAPITCIPAGDWRAILWVIPTARVSLHEDCLSLGEDLYAGVPWPSREVAEEKLAVLLRDPQYLAWQTMGWVDARGVRFFPAAA